MYTYRKKKTCGVRSQPQEHLKRERIDTNIPLFVGVVALVPGIFDTINDRL